MGNDVAVAGGSDLEGTQGPGLERVVTTSALITVVESVVGVRETSGGTA